MPVCPILASFHPVISAGPVSSSSSSSSSRHWDCWRTLRREKEALVEWGANTGLKERSAGANDRKEGRKMRLAPYLRGSVVVLAVVTWTAAACVAAPAKGGDGRPWADQFGEKKVDLLSRGTSRFWALEPGYQLRLEGRE